MAKLYHVIESLDVIQRDNKNIWQRTVLWFREVMQVLTNASNEYIDSIFRVLQWAVK